MGVTWEAPGVYVALGATDIRKQTNSLAAMVHGELRLDPFSGELYVFCKRRGTLIKELYWDGNGFCLWQERLERHRFRWPVQAAEVLKMRVKDLEGILSGLDIAEAYGKLAHETVV